MDLKEKLKNSEEEMSIPIVDFTFKPIKYNSRLKLGNLTLMTDKKINLFHRIMFKFWFGIKVERIKDEQKTI